MERKEILHILDYFALFSYPPSLDEVWTFYPQKIIKNDLKILLNNMAVQKTIEHSAELDRYALKGKSNMFNTFKKRQRNALEKKRLIRSYTTILSRFPWINLIAFSGSISMNNTKIGDDIDLFIVTAPGQLWTGRLTSIFLAKVMGLHRTKKTTNVQNKVCLNLFIENGFLSIPEKKRNEYVAHELLQIHTIYDKNNTNALLMYENEWICMYFPNVTIPRTTVKCDTRVSLFMKQLEFLAKKLQLSIMHSSYRSLYKNVHQLWFFPNDYEKRIRSKFEIR